METVVHLLQQCQKSRVGSGYMMTDVKGLGTVRKIISVTSITAIQYQLYCVLFVVYCKMILNKRI